MPCFSFELKFYSVISLLMTRVMARNCFLENHCLKSVSIRSFSGPHFPSFGPENSKYEHFSRRQCIVRQNILDCFIEKITISFKLILSFDHS